jgi:hypothetical protein
MSQLIVVLLTYINPFCFVINPNTLRDGLLFGDEKGPWDTTMITEVLKIKSKKKFGFELTTRKWRQISTVINKKFMRGDDLDLDNEDDDVADDLMAGHSTQTAIAKYGRLKGLVWELSAESIDIFREICDTNDSW